MKRFFLSLVLAVLTALPTFSMSYEEARKQAWFLTDKMAYELNLTPEQYDRAYEINLDYLMSIRTASDCDGYYWRYRDADFRCVLFDWQYNLFASLDYFFRPVRWVRSAWYYPVFDHYRVGYYYFACPTIYVNYRGGMWRRRSHNDPSPYMALRPQPGRGMRDHYAQGDWRPRPDQGRPGGRPGDGRHDQGKPDGRPGDGRHDQGKPDGRPGDGRHDQGKPDANRPTNGGHGNNNSGSGRPDSGRPSTDRQGNTGTSRPGQNLGTGHGRTDRPSSGQSTNKNGNLKIATPAQGSQGGLKTDGGRLTNTQTTTGGWRTSNSGGSLSTSPSQRGGNSTIQRGSTTTQRGGSTTRPSTQRGSSGSGSSVSSGRSQRGTSSSSQRSSGSRSTNSSSKSSSTSSGRSFGR